MKQFYDIIIIGSGISALSTLYGLLKLKKKLRIAIVAGKPKFNIKHNHPKIFKDMLYHNNFYSHKLNSSSLSLPGNMGGLVYFWGEQCNLDEKKKRKNKNNLEIQNFFSDFLELKSGRRLFKKKIKNFQVTFDEPDRSIKTEKSINKFKKYFKNKSIIFNNEAMVVKGNQVFLDNHKNIIGKKIFLCAGLIGNINLLKSIDNNINFTFKDHRPSIDLVYSKIIRKKSFIKSIYSMICKIYSKTNEIKTYAKFYPIRSLEILFFLGRIKFILPKFILNYKFKLDNFYFVQKWDNKSVMEYQLDNYIFKKNKLKVEDFKKLNNVYDELNIMKIFTFKPNFLNFHFHDLRIVKNKQKIPVNKFLKKVNPSIYCPGLLSKKNINCLPPSFSSIIDNSIFLRKNFYKL